MSLTRKLFPVLVLLASCVPALPPRVPHSLVGTWITDTPAYAHRTLQFGSNATITFGQGDGDYSKHPVTQIEREIHWPVLVFRFVFLDEYDEEVQLGCRYDAETGTLSLDNQQAVTWRIREEASKL